MGNEKIKYVLNEDFLKSIGFYPQDNNTDTIRTYHNKSARLRIIQSFGVINIERYLYDEKYNEVFHGEFLLSDFMAESDEDLIFVIRRLREFKRRVNLINEYA